MNNEGNTMNLWKHEDQTRYDKCVYGASSRIMVRFDEEPEASLRHLEKTVLNPLISALNKAKKKQDIVRIDVELALYSTSTMFNFAEFLPTSSAMRLFIEKNFCYVNDWKVSYRDQCTSGAIEFNIIALGENK